MAAKSLRLPDPVRTMATRTLIFLLDRSGSMESCWDDTIGGFNSFVTDQMNLGGKLTLVQFDHEYYVAYENIELKNVKPLTRETFKPRGSTALLDAIGKAIKANTDSQNVTLIVLTDGHENASREYTKSHIKDLIEQKTKDGWTVMYLGANQDAFSEARSMGIGAANTMNYDTNSTPEMFARLSQTVSSQAASI